MTPQAPVPVPAAELLVIAADQLVRGEHGAAARLLSHVIAALPDHAEALELAGVAAIRAGQRGEALVLMRRATACGSNGPVHWRNLCEVLRLEDHLDEALAAGRRAVALAPGDAVALNHLGLVHADRLEHDLAEASLRAAIAADPGFAAAHLGLAEILLRRGQLAEGWEEYEWRFSVAGAAVNLPPGHHRAWDGQPLPAGRLLLVADQGYGDGIQFCRYLPWALARCPDLVLACNPELWPALSQFGVRQLVVRWADVPEAAAWAPLSGLPRLAGTRLDSIPADVPYLRADPASAARWRARLDLLLPPGFQRVGLAWAGRPTHGNDHRRSASLDALAALFQAERVAYVSLQKGSRGAEAGRYVGAAPLLNLGPELGGWDDTMGVLAGLDAVVTVDTAVAHLAGAMGRPVHLMLPHAAEWRWLLGREDSPWYPTLRLYRQPEPGAWGAVAARVRQGLI